MKINKDTKNVVEAAKLLKRYCNRYKTCKWCIFHDRKEGCLIGYPVKFGIKTRFKIKKEGEANDT